ncbi:MAG: class I SAM-dependent methyltransferase, partial [Candidatus Binatia bacterium]
MSTEDTSQHPLTVAEALEIHAGHADGVLPTADGAAVKRLYVELGGLLEAAVGDDLDAVPLLSYPEIAPVVSDLMEEVHGFVLDAGCGPYPTLSLLLGSRPDKTVVALDIGLGIVRLARAYAAKRGIRLIGVVADIEALPFRNNAFDGAACEDTIEHVPDDARAIRELARVMKSHGRVVLTTPNRIRLDVLSRRLKDRLRGRGRSAPSAYFAASTHLREYTWSQTERLIAPWFRVVVRAQVPWSGNSRARLANWLVRLSPMRLLDRIVVLS